MPDHPPGILVVDDDGCLRDFLAAHLASWGFAPYVAADARQALDLLRRHPVRAALLDVTMPDDDGPAVLRLLRAEAPELRACFMTGGSAQYSPGELLAMGAERVLAKPFAPGDLAATLRRLLQEEPQGVGG